MSKKNKFVVAAVLTVGLLAAVWWLARGRGPGDDVSTTLTAQPEAARVATPTPAPTEHAEAASAPVCKHASAVEALKQAAALSDVTQQRAALKNVVACGPRTLADCRGLAKALQAVTDHVTNHLELMILANPATSAESALTLGNCYIDLMRDKNPALQTVGAMGAGRMRDKNAKGELLKLLKSGKSELAAVASQALGELGDESAITDLITGIEESDSNSLLGLEKLGVPAVYAVAAMLRSGLSKQREGDLEYFIYSRHGLQYRDVLRKLAQDENALVRAAAIAGMLSNADPLAVDVVNKATKDPDPHVRGSVASYLEYVRNVTAASQALDLALHDQDEGVQMHAVGALKRLHKEMVIKDQDPAANRFFIENISNFERVQEKNQRRVNLQRHIYEDISDLLTAIEKNK